MAVRRGGVRRPIYQENNAPRGYGQQRGQSPYLDREARNVSDALVGDQPYEREPQRHEPPQEAVSRTQPHEEERQESQYRSYGEDEPQSQLQVQDRWGRSPSHPHYGQDPMRIGQEKDSRSGSLVGRALTGSSLYGDKRPRNEDFKPGALDNIRGLLGEDPENEDGTFSNYQLGRISGSREGLSSQVPEYGDFQYEVGLRGENEPYGTTADDYVAPQEKPKAPGLGSSSNMPQGSMWSQDYRFLGGEGLPDVMNLGYGDPSRMQGFATDQWGPGGDPNYDEDSIKNTFGKIASRYEAKPSSLEAIVADPDFQALFPGASVAGFDKIDFGDGRPVDVLVHADPNSDTANGWSFQTQDSASGLSASGDMSGLGGFGDAESAYAAVSQLPPNLSQEEMESALTSAFAGVPGFEEAYKESVKINGVWYDLIGGYGGADAKWHGLQPKVEGGHGGAGLFGATGAIAPGNSSPNAINSALVGPTVDPNDSNLQRLLQQILLGNPEGQAMFNAYQNAI